MEYKIDTKEDLRLLVEEHKHGLLIYMYALLANHPGPPFGLCDFASMAFCSVFGEEAHAKMDDLALYKDLLDFLGFKEPKKRFDMFYWWHPDNKYTRLKKINKLLNKNKNK